MVSSAAMICPVPASTPMWNLRQDRRVALRETLNCTVFKGQARFRSAREVAVGTELLAAERIFINVGGRRDPADPRRRPGRAPWRMRRLLLTGTSLT
jgi:pyruvate/2-oxoglutarate dehydrogenase complex dihydrolipoamide dehydrogenase (E3) component